MFKRDTFSVFSVGFINRREESLNYNDYVQQHWGLKADSKIPGSKKAWTINIMFIFTWHRGVFLFSLCRNWVVLCTAYWCKRVFPLPPILHLQSELDCQLGSWVDRSHYRNPSDLFESTRGNKNIPIVSDRSFAIKRYLQASQWKLNSIRGLLSKLRLSKDQ